ncbi:MAG: hypothetical protein ACRC1H_17440, partial [Caldilineaceae bacterium]
ELAWIVGAVAVQQALDGASDVLIGLQREADLWQAAPVALEQVVGRERHFPTAWLAAGFEVAPEFNAYAAPLIDPLSPDPLLW